MNTPFFENRLGHRPELLERKFADAGQQLLAGDVADTAPGVFADSLLGVIQRFADEQIGLALVARVFGRDFREGFFETDFVHVTVLRFQPPGPADALPDTF